MLQLRSWLGCRVLIPCNGSTTDSDSFKWFYKEKTYSKDVQLYFVNKNGIKHYDASRRPKVDVMPNRSLIINNFTNKDQGIYWCENCLQDNCKPSSFITLQREIRNEIQETFYLLSDSSFTHECPSEFDNIKWTFEAAQRKLEESSEMATFSTNKTLHIGSVKNTNAGKYACWVSNCGGPSQKLLTVNLCIITVHQVHSNLSCAVTCNVGLSNLKNISSLLKSYPTILVDIDSSGSLICNSSEILDDRISTTSSYSSSATLNTTMGESKKTDYFMIVIYGVLATFTFFIILSILSFCSKSRICPASFHLSCCGFPGEAEEESTVIYSSFTIRTPPNARNQHTVDGSCIYSELKL